MTVNNGAILGGSGFISGPVVNNGIMLPGYGVGTLTMSNLNMAAGSFYKFEFNGTTNDQIVVASANGLVLDGGSFSLFQAGGTVGLTTPGTYKLIKYSGTLSGAGTSAGNLDSTWTTASAGNPHIANPQSGYSYSFALSAGWITVTIAANSNIGTWGVDANGNWSSAGNWIATFGTMPPRNAGDAALLGTGTALRTVTLDADESVGGITMNNTNSFVIASAGKTLFLDAAGSGAALTVAAGTSNAIQTAVTLKDNLTATVFANQSVAISGLVANGAAAKALTFNGPGTLALTAANTYGPAAGTVGTTINSGTVQLGNSSALGAGDVNVTASATIQATAGLTLANNINISSATTLDNNGNSITVNGAVTGSGSLVKNGGVSLTLNNNNSYAGSTTVNGGILSISTDANLGAAPGASTANSIVLNGGELLGNNSFTVNVNRNIGIGASTGGVGTNAIMDVATGQAMTIAGNITSAGNTGANGLVVNGGAFDTGTLILGGADTFNGATVIANGTLQLANTLALQNSSLNYTNGTLLFDSAITATTIGSFGGTLDLSLANLGAANVTLTAGGNGAGSTYSGGMSGGGAFVKTGGGTMVMIGTNSYTGNTTVNGGALQLLTNGVINGGATVVSGGGQMLVGGGTLTASALSAVNAGGSQFFLTNGTATFNAGLQTDLSSSAASTSLISVSGGTLTTTSLAIGRTGLANTSQPANGSTAQGLYVNGGTVNIIGALNASTSGNANSSANVRMDSGSLNVGGPLVIGLNNSGRWSELDINGGSLVVTDAVTGISIGGPYVGNEVFLMRNGTASTPIIGFGYAAIGAFGVLNQTGGTLYIGSGGIVQLSSIATNTITLNGGVTAASADWGTSLNITLGSATFQCADSTNGAHNISLSGTLSGSGGFTKNGGGTLTISGTNIYTGNTTVSTGTLIVNSFANLTNTAVISLPAAGTLDLSQMTYAATPGILNLGEARTQTFSGAGTILGGLIVTSNGTLNVGDSFLGVLTVTNAAQLGGTVNFGINNTATPNSGRLVAGAGITVTSNAVVVVNNIGGALAAGNTFHLFGTAVSGITNLTLPALTAPLAWTNRLAVDGSIAIVASGQIPSAANSAITAAPGVTNANGVATVTVTVTERDAGNNAVTNNAVTPVISTTSGTLSALTAQGNGIYTATLTSPATPGYATVSGTISGAAIGTNATVYFAGNPGRFNVGAGFVTKTYNINFTNAPGQVFSVISTTNLTVPSAQWFVETDVANPPSQHMFETAGTGYSTYSFTVRPPTNGQVFYRVRTP